MMVLYIQFRLTDYSMTFQRGTPTLEDRFPIFHPMLLQEKFLNGRTSFLIWSW